LDGVGGGWAQAQTETLLATREDLLGGLKLVWDHMQAGDAHVIHEGHSTRPIDAGVITLALLEGCEAELTRRNAL
jgi:hypothetical protein